jgi:hypothetical protein
MTTFLVFAINHINAQTDSTETVIKTELGEVEGTVKSTSNEALTNFHSPKKATIMSALLPGLGQIYNKKYWKVPIIYGGFAAAGYYLNDNLKQIDRYTDAFKAETDGDPNTVNDTGFNSGQLQDVISRYKTWRDLSYIAIGAIYVLNIIDANVDAHLFYFDVGEDLSLNIQPFVTPSREPMTGLTLSLKL